MKQKLIFLDIDGTLLPPGEMTVPASAVEAIRQVRANGHKVFLCTGRNLRMTKPLLAYGFDGFVCSAGGYVGCDGKILVDLPWSLRRSRACGRCWGVQVPSAHWKPGMILTAASG